jgi:uncharacterized protein (TIGR02594 family)
MPENELLIRDKMAKAILTSPYFDECPWMAYAQAEIGIKEGSPRVDEYLKSVGLSVLKDWCSAFVQWCMKRAGFERTGPPFKGGFSAAGAKSWLEYGLELTTPKFGAIAVFDRNSFAGAGHVGFYIGPAPPAGGHILILGGNQNNEVNVWPQDKAKLLTYRYPSWIEKGVAKAKTF